MKDPFAAVLGLSPTGLYAIRELGAEGIPVLGLDGSRQPGGYSRYLNAGPRLIIESGEARAVARLLDASERHGARGVLIPTSDAYIEFVVRNAGALSARYDFQASYTSGAAAQLMDKGRFTTLCREHGVEAPAFWRCGSTELAGLSERVAYPCLLKPALIHLVKDFMAGRKVFIARDAGQFRLAAAQAAAAGGDWLVQEIIPGPESSITVFGAYFAKDGFPRQSFTGRKLRQFPPGFGSASLVRSEVLEETRRRSEAFLSAAGFRGIAGTEFKLDERDGKLKMIEVNPRPTLWFALSHAAGKRIALSAFNELAGRPPVQDGPQEDGVVWRYLLKDAYSSLFYRLKGRDFVLAPPELDAALRPGRTVGPLYDPADPLPLWGELLNYAGKLASRAFR